MSCLSKLEYCWLKKQMFIKERDETIATMQPYRPQEKWETTFMCQKDQFVKLKFESIDFTRIANDILKIQFYTHDMSKLIQSLNFKPW